VVRAGRTKVRLQAGFRAVLLATVLATAALVASRAVAQDTNDVTVPASKMPLFNGTDLSGWMIVPHPGAEASATWIVTNGVIHCAGKPAGFLRTTDRYANYLLTVNWRFVPAAKGADNAGVLIHMQSPDRVWPECVGYQGKHESQGDLVFMGGADCKEHKGMSSDTLPKQGSSNEKDIGEWNLCEIYCDGDRIAAFVNGKRMNEASECNLKSGFIGFQSGGGEYEIRDVTIEPIKHAQ
jgi:hypothetical protein